MPVTIRLVESRDCAPLAAMLEPYARETTVSFSAIVKTADALAAQFESRHAAGRATFVAEEDGEILGYVTYDQFRANDGYRKTMEHTIMLAPEARGRGAGRLLMQALEKHASVAGNHVMVGAITAENEASIAFHAALGYEIVGRMPQVGIKFDRWLDLVLMQKLL